jgi:hypothetical protein
MDVKNLTYRTRMKLMPLLILLAGLLVYWMAIGNTVELASQVKELELKASRLSDAPLQIQMLKRRLQEMESRIGNHSGTISQEEIFRKLSAYCRQNGLVIREFPVPHKVISDDYRVDTYRTGVEGNYRQLLRLVYHLEQQTYLGKMAGLKFELKKDRRTREEYLVLNVFLQTVN